MKSIIDGLKKTRESIFQPMRRILSSGSLDSGAIEELEELLYSADLGVDATERIIGSVRDKASSAGIDEYLEIISNELLSIIGSVTAPEPQRGNPTVIVIVGVNGVGKTSTIGKLAARFKKEGRSVLLAACDTFRAAAIDQLEMWAKRADVPVVRHRMGSDPAAVAFDAVKSAIAKKIDVVIIDTAGRLHTKTNLMEELGKIIKVLSGRIDGIGLEAWLVLDANAGQNSIRQTEVFTELLPVTGIVLTKLDSTAKGGAIIPIQQKLGVPVLYIGTGESTEDLEPFDSSRFVEALIG
jgi:fused signal recognition particle receptor